MFSPWVCRRMGAAVVLAAVVLAPIPVAATTDSESGSVLLVAYLDGQPIKPVEVANYYCEDFAYPVINCYRDPQRLETRVASLLAATATDYVVIYDYMTYAGPYMYVSEDYTVLALLGWNDRISSLRSVNSQAGHLFTDWFYAGTGWYFCCNSQYASLGSYDNTFSSVHHG